MFILRANWGSCNSLMFSSSSAGWIWEKCSQLDTKQNPISIQFLFFTKFNFSFGIYNYHTTFSFSYIVQIRIEYSISTGRLDVNDYKNQLYIVFYVEKITAYTYTDEWKSL